VLERRRPGTLPDILFFNIGELTIAGRKVRALHHGMSGVPGLELFGRWEERDDMRGAIVKPARTLGFARSARAPTTRHARVRLDPLAAARDLHGRRAEGVPGVAAGDLV